MLDEITPNNQIQSSNKKGKKFALVYPNVNAKNIKAIRVLHIETLFMKMFQWFNGLQIL